MEQSVYDILVDELEKMIPSMYEGLDLEKDVFSKLPTRYQAEMMVNEYIKRITNA